MRLRAARMIAYPEAAYAIVVAVKSPHRKKSLP
jgi:hypothetical protein